MPRSWGLHYHCGVRGTVEFRLGFSTTTRSPQGILRRTIAGVVVYLTSACPHCVQVLGVLDVPRARLCAKPNECRHECAQQTPNERTPRSRSARTYARASMRAHGCRYGRCVREAPYDDRRKKPVTVTNARAQRGRAQTNTHARAWSGRAAENTSHLAVARASTYAPVQGDCKAGLAWLGTRGASMAFEPSGGRCAVLRCG